MEIETFLIDELYSKEKHLERELADIKQQIKQRYDEKCKGNIGKYFKFNGNNYFEYYKVLDHVVGGKYYGVIICYDDNIASINIKNNICLGISNVVEVTEEEFNEQYHKALEVIERNLHNGEYSYCC